MAYRKIVLALAIAVLGGGATLVVASDDASETKGVQTSLREKSAAGKAKVKASGDEATAPRKNAAAKAGDARQTKAVGETTDFVDNGPKK